MQKLWPFGHTRRFEDFEEKDDWGTQFINQLINDKGVCRTAPATPGLLII